MLRRNRRSAAARMLLLLAPLAGFLTGCERPQALPPLPPRPVMPLVDASSPQSAARSFLLLVQTELRAIAHHDTENGRQAREHLMKLVSRAELQKLTKRVPKSAKDPLQTTCELALNNWEAYLAFYAETVDLEGLRPENGLDAQRIVLQTTADKAVPVRVEVVREGDGWAVSAISLRSAAAAPTLPASAPGAAARPAASASLPAAAGGSPGSVPSSSPATQPSRGG